MFYPLYDTGFEYIRHWCSKFIFMLEKDHFPNLQVDPIQLYINCEWSLWNFNRCHKCQSLCKRHEPHCKHKIPIPILPRRLPAFCNWFRPVTSYPPLFTNSVARFEEHTNWPKIVTWPNCQLDECFFLPCCVILPNFHLAELSTGRIDNWPNCQLVELSAV